MRQYKYTGVFSCIGFEGEVLRFSLEVHCNGFIEAFILLTAKALNQGKCYQLDWITDEKGTKVEVEDLITIKIFK